jgi:hypothetical protein
MVYPSGNGGHLSVILCDFTLCFSAAMLFSSDMGVQCMGMVLLMNLSILMQVSLNLHTTLTRQV